VYIVCFVREVCSTWEALRRFSEGDIDHVIPTTFVRGGVYTPDTQGGPCSGNGKFVSLANTEFEKGNWNVSTPQGLPMCERDPQLPKCYIQGMTVFVIPLFP
jgi:hypothetical protein